VSTGRIEIRWSPGCISALRWGGYPGWTWRCPCCDTGGRASNWSQVRRTTRIPAFQRVLAAVDRHLRDRHRLEHAAYIVRKEAL